MSYLTSIIELYYDPLTFQPDTPGFKGIHARGIVRVVH